MRETIHGAPFSRWLPFLLGLGSLALAAEASTSFQPTTWERDADAATPALPRAVTAPGSGDVFRADRNFTTRLEAGSGVVRAVAATPDGGFVVVGRFSTIAGQSHLAVAKYRTDGTIDPAFNPEGGCDGEIAAVAVQADGRIVVAGNFTTFNGAARVGIARLDADGTLDATFDPGAGFDNAVQSLALQTDGRIIVGGDFTRFNGTPARGLVRLDGHGSLDVTFSVGPGFGRSADSRPAIRAVAVQADGKIVVGGSFDSYAGAACQDLVRLSSIGALDPTFSARGGSATSAGTNGVFALAIQQDRRIVVAGIFPAFNGVARRGLTRLNPDGTTDAAFDPGTAGDSAQILSLALQPDGRIVVGGNFANFNGTASGSIVRVNPNGTVDTAFNPGAGFGRSGGDAMVSSLALLTDGRIVAGGEFTTLNNQAAIDVARLTAFGPPDPLATGPFRGPAGTLAAAAVEGGKILVAGFLGFANGVPRTGIARLNGDGTLDPTFAPSGSGFDADIVSRFAVQPDGKIVVIGGFTHYDGRPANGIARLNPDGSLDESFIPVGSGFDGSLFFAVALQADGKIVVAGNFTQYQGAPRAGIARLNPDGSLDTAFNPGAGFDSPVLALAVQADGKIVAGGAFVHFDGTSRRAIARLNADGSLDPTFAPGQGFTFDGILGNSGIVETLAVQPDRRIVAGGDFTTYDGVSRRSIARLESNGSLDRGFDPGAGFADSVINLAVQPDGKVVAGGAFSTPGGASRLRLVRLHPDGHMDGAFSVLEAFGTGAHPMDDGRMLVTGTGAIGRGVEQVGFAVVTADTAGPVFTIQPVGASVNAGDTVTFTATATGDPAPTYQWYKGTTLLAGRTGNTLSLGPVQPADAGSYTVVATNSAGSTTSNAAVLSVLSGGTANGYGGGGAVSEWFVLANLAVLACARRNPSRARSRNDA